MKHTITTLLVFLLIFMLPGCRLENSSNGKLDGYWKLTSIEDGTVPENSVNLRKGSVFWSVQKNLLQVRDNNEGSVKEYVFRFRHVDDELTLSNGQLYNKNEGNSTIEDISVLSKYGIRSQPETFQIDRLTSSRMTLTSGDWHLHFEKF